MPTLNYNQLWSLFLGWKVSILANFGRNGAKSQSNINLFMYLLHTARALPILCTCVQYWAPTRPICFVRGLIFATFCYFLLLFATFCYFFATFCYFLLLFGTFGKLFLLTATCGYLAATLRCLFYFFLLLSATFCYFLLLFATFCYFLLLFATFCYFLLLFATVCCQKLFAPNCATWHYSSTLLHTALHYYFKQTEENINWVVIC